MSPAAGRLLIVGTPIGNLGDLSPRAREALEAADVIACEDTRRTGRLLQLVGMPKRPLVVANEHTELSRVPDLIERLSLGETVALVSDAGMPGVSDPGQRLVAAVIAAGFRVEVVPGPTALTSALVLSGLSTDRFVFEGFLARKGHERVQQLAEIDRQPRTVVIYESPKRVLKTLNDLAVVCGGERRVAVARELTKLYEEVVRGTLVEVQKRLAETDPRGEYVIVLDGAGESAEITDDVLSIQLRERLEGGASRRDAVAEVMASTGASKRRVYDLALALP